jgi:hypothetical protein
MKNLTREEEHAEMEKSEQDEINRLVARHMNMLGRLLDSDAGYRGLYGGLTKDEIRARKQLAAGEEITDWMSPDELAANIFRASHAETKLLRERIQDQHDIDQVHFQIGQIVRQALVKMGCAMPEDLPVPEKSARQSLQEELLWLKQSDTFDPFEMSSEGDM